MSAKYLVMKFDGNVPAWPWFVLGARDPAALPALRAYRAAAEACGMTPAYLTHLEEHIAEFEAFGPRRNEQSTPDRDPFGAGADSLPVLTNLYKMRPVSFRSLVDRWLAKMLSELVPPPRGQPGRGPR